MLIDKVVFNFHEVGEKSLEEIKVECLASFATDLKIALTSSQEHIRKFWLDKFVRADGTETEGSIANYKIFQDLFGSKIKFNSKNIVFEETLYNGLDRLFSPQQACMDFYGLEFVPESENCSAYYRFRKDGIIKTCYTDYCEFVEYPGNKREDSEERLRNFYTAFGVGEFPFITITVIRLGNKDHYFYSIHR